MDSPLCVSAVKPVARPVRREGTPRTSKESLLKMGGVIVVGAPKKIGGYVLMM